MTILGKISEVKDKLVSRNIQGTSAVITGAGGGLGSALALELATIGVNKLVLWDISEIELTKVKELIISKMGKSMLNITTITCNLLEETSIEEAVKNSIKALDDDGPDMLINNAGIVFGGTLTGTSLNVDKLKMSLQINCISQFQTCRLFIPYMRSPSSIGKYRLIMSICSAGGLLAGVGLCEYNTAKFALKGMMESLRLELKAVNAPIKISIVCPSAFDSKLFEGFRQPFYLPVQSRQDVACRVANVCIRLVSTPLSPNGDAPLFMKKYAPSLLLESFLANCVFSSATNIKNFANSIFSGSIFYDDELVLIPWFTLRVASVSHALLPAKVFDFFTLMSGSAGSTADMKFEQSQKFLNMNDTDSNQSSTPIYNGKGKL